jgi:hypothetical protein
MYMSSTPGVPGTPGVPFTPRGESRSPYQPIQQLLVTPRGTGPAIPVSAGGVVISEAQVSSPAEGSPEATPMSARRAPVQSRGTTLQYVHTVPQTIRGGGMPYTVSYQGGVGYAVPQGTYAMTPQQYSPVTTAVPQALPSSPNLAPATVESPRRGSGAKPGAARRDSQARSSSPNLANGGANNSVGGLSRYGDKEKDRRPTEKLVDELYEDAFAREQRLKEMQMNWEQNMEREQQQRLKELAKTQRQRRKIYHGQQDHRTHLEREEEAMRKKEEKRKHMEEEARKREEAELAECTFRPSLHKGKQDPLRGGPRVSQPGSPVMRSPRDGVMSADPMSYRLQQLAERQRISAEALKALAREDLEMKERLSQLHADLYDEIQREETQRVVAMLQDADSQSTAQRRLIERVRDMVAAGGNPDIAQKMIVEELVNRSQDEVQRRVMEAFQPQRFEIEGALYTRRLALVHELEAAEAQAMAIRGGTLCEEAKAFGFEFGLAEQARRLLNATSPISLTMKSGLHSGLHSGLMTGNVTPSASPTPVASVGGTMYFTRNADPCSFGPRPSTPRSQRASVAESAAEFALPPQPLSPSRQGDEVRAEISAALEATELLVSAGSLPLGSPESPVSITATHGAFDNPAAVATSPMRSIAADGAVAEEESFEEEPSDFQEAPAEQPLPEDFAGVEPTAVAPLVTVVPTISPPANAIQTFNTIDADGDGVITRAEFNAAMAQKVPKVPMLAMQMVATAGQQPQSLHQEQAVPAAAEAQQAAPAMGPASGSATPQVALSTPRILMSPRGSASVPMPAMKPPMTTQPLTTASPLVQGRATLPGAWTMPSAPYMQQLPAGRGHASIPVPGMGMGQFVPGTGQPGFATGQPGPGMAMQMVPLPQHPGPGVQTMISPQATPMQSPMLHARRDMAPPTGFMFVAAAPHAVPQALPAVAAPANTIQAL